MILIIIIIAIGVYLCVVCVYFSIEMKAANADGCHSSTRRALSRFKVFNKLIFGFHSDEKSTVSQLIVLLSNAPNYTQTQTTKRKANASCFLLLLLCNKTKLNRQLNKPFMPSPLLFGQADRNMFVCVLVLVAFHFVI